MGATRPAGDFDYDTPANARYAQQRQTEPRIAAQVHTALGSARTVVNVGAGAGSYEPEGLEVTAVEPSASMRAQRASGAAPAVAASAEALPFEDDAFDAAMAMVTVHQWPDVARGVAELRRVASGPVVILTFDPSTMSRFWLAEYAPELLAREAPRFPTIEALCQSLGPGAYARPVPVPIDCVDGFMEAYYARPEAFLDDHVRDAQSSWGFIDGPTTAVILARLRADLESGRWDERHGVLRTQPEFDGSLTLVVDPGAPLRGGRAAAT